MQEWTTAKNGATIDCFVCGAQFYRSQDHIKRVLTPLATVVIGGLVTSTALTLLVIPALYARTGRIYHEPAIQNYSLTNPIPHRS